MPGSDVVSGFSRTISLTMLLAIVSSGCASNPRVNARVLQHPDRRAAVHVLNRMTFGPRPGDADRVQAMGLAAYIDEQLHPGRINDAPLDARLLPLTALGVGSRVFAADYYLPMVAARQVFTDTQKS